MREEIKNWWEQAERDIKTAENSYKSEDYYASVFWCQQALEKGLKAYIMFHKRLSSGKLNFYSLIKLARTANVPSKFHLFLRSISPEYYISRYPDASEETPYKLYTKEDTKTILEKTNEIFKWLKIQMKK